MPAKREKDLTTIFCWGLTIALIIFSTAYYFYSSLESALSVLAGGLLMGLHFLIVSKSILKWCHPDAPGIPLSILPVISLKFVFSGFLFYILHRLGFNLFHVVIGITVALGVFLTCSFWWLLNAHDRKIHD